jgi:hypothetical protein
MRELNWIEMPAVGTGAVDDAIRAKYPVRGKAFLMHREGKVYVAFGDEFAREEAARHWDCRQLTSREARLFEKTLPFPIPPQLFSNNQNDESGPARLGDLVAWLTRKAGIAECNGCRQRKRWLNRISFWGWGRI